MKPQTASAFALLALATACGPAGDGTPGRETSACDEGLCLQGLECRSNLCVEPDWNPPGSSGADPSSTTDAFATEGSTSGDGQESTGDAGDTALALDLSMLLATPRDCRWISPVHPRRLGVA